ncbi:cytochrome P450 [Chitinophaga pinensis]|uniref:Cytochrome P450 n=1 Tax=Chitinophaga pinensis (strain ATCC 43595 / DSM 2588 / LMG 13176 / NBRC 15968 / NCIMB 11800 / UQM 2034) TaxID=485918 RepID=A0A979G6G4_CHIPD|nr:cytochrome P450 [Chitinophaga pinensis]ACU61558.1 cytochrome P450 [Chitinophaga pinensis DSM 2588]
MTPSTLKSPLSWHQQLQDEQAVYFDPAFRFYFGGQGAWQVFRHKEVQRVLSDHEVFSNEYMPKSDDNLLGSNLNQTDPPRHRQLRALVSKAFAPAVIAKLEAWIHHECKELLQTVLAKGEMDFVKVFSIPLPGRVTAQLLGVPDQDHDQVNAWVNAISSDPAVIGMDAYFQAQQEMGRLFTALLEERAKTPQSDLISHLLHAEIDGERLSMPDTLAFCIALLIAGNETTNGFLANAMYTFATTPDVQSHLQAHIEDLPSALNEVLRYAPPVQSMCRIAKMDVELGGQLIRKGDLINAWLSAANRDPSVFRNPDTFDIHRNNIKMVSFGHGAHYCIGAMLARMEAKIAFEIIFSAIKNVTLKPGVTPARNPSTIVAGFLDLPIVFEPK